MRAVQLHQWIGYLLLKNSIHLVTQFLHETAYYTKPSNSLSLLIDPRRKLRQMILGGWGDGVVGRKIIVGNLS